MIVKLKSKPEPTIEAFRVNDNNLPALIRRLGGHATLYVDPQGHITVDSPRTSNAYEGEYVVFSGDDIEVLSAERFAEQYEEVNPRLTTSSIGGFPQDGRGFAHAVHGY